MSVIDQPKNREIQKERFFSDELVVANVGIRPFYDSLEIWGAKVYQVDWTVPAGGDKQMIILLDNLLGGLYN